LETVRSFIAIAIPADIRQKICAAYAPLLALPDQISWVKSQNLHLTLRFLGEVGVEQLEGVRAVLKQAAQACAPFLMGFSDIGVFPNKKRPRVIWLGMEDATARLIKLQQELESGLRGCGFVPEDREFKPHLTLGRVRRLKDRDRFISALGALCLPELPRFRVEQVSLMRSQLRPQGSLYTELDNARLGTVMNRINKFDERRE
jgi:2'-5' RNA ligase